MELLLYIFFISGITIGWQILLNDHPALTQKLKAKSKLFVCGVCQVFWLSLIIAFFTDPLRTIDLHFRSAFLEEYQEFITFLLAWQAIAVGGYFVRYGFLLLMELLKFNLIRNKN